MNKLNPHDLNWIITRLPKAVVTALQERPSRAFLAGGFIRSVIANEQVNDIDLFVPSADEAGQLAMKLADNDPTRLYKTDYAYTVRGFKPPVQIIHRWTFDTPESCVESFDFTIAKSAVYFAESLPGTGTEGAWHGIVADSFYADLAAKRLIYTSPVRNEDPGGSMLRVLKFYQRGYRIPLSSMGAVMARMLRGVSEINWDKRRTMNQEEWEAQMGHVLTGLLKEVDPQLDPAHLAHLPDAPKP